MKKPAFFLCFILSITYSALCQENKTLEPTKRQEVIHKVDSLNEVAFKVKRFNLDSSFVLLDKAAAIAVKIDYKKGMATNLLYRAGIYQQNGFDKKALGDYYKALDISELIKDTFNIARANQQIANVLQASGNIHEAEKVFNQAMADYKRLGKLDETVNTKNSLGVIRLLEEDLSGASQFFSEALADSRKMHYMYGTKKSLYNIGLLNIERGALETAVKYIDSSIMIDKDLLDYYGMALGKIKLSFIANRQGRYDEAIKIGTEAYENAHIISAVQLETEAIDNIIVAYKQENNLKQVVDWQDKLIKRQKEITKHEKSYALNFVELLKNQQDKEISADKGYQKSRWENYILVTVLLAMFILSLLAYLWFKNYKRAESYSLELADKNLQIEKSSLSLDLLNKAISKQNLRLEESNLMKDKLLSIISHDLRHPLVNTKGILELVNLNLVNPEETRQLLGQLESQYLRSLTLLDNLLFWIRGQMKGEMIDKVRINLRQLMEDLVEDHKLPLLNKRIVAYNNVQPDLFVYGDKEMLKIIFRNLLSNAVKFTPQEGEIIVSSSTENGIAIHIKDSGVGMNEETLSKVSAKQYFTTRGTSNESGSGFGLMLCRDLIEKHRGNLTIQSEPGRGSIFSVQLPSGMPDPKTQQE